MKDEMVRLLDDDDYKSQMISDLKDVCQRLGTPGCSGRVATIVAEMTRLKEQLKPC